MNSIGTTPVLPGAVDPLDLIGDDEQFEIHFDPSEQALLEQLLQDDHQGVNELENIINNSDNYGGYDHRDVNVVSNSVDGNPSTKTKRSNKRQKKSSNITHKDVERKRRQEMASLHQSLLTLLPVEHLMGKRSMSDHLGEAAKYIRLLEAKNQALRLKRDELLKNPLTDHNHQIDPHYSSSNCSMVSSNGSIPSATSPQQQDHHNNNNHHYQLVQHDHDHDRPISTDTTSVRFLGSDQHVTVEKDWELRLSACRGSRMLEVVVECSLHHNGALSGISMGLTQEGLDIINCVSGKTNGKWLHILRAEVVMGQQSIDLLGLQSKLKAAISAAV